MAIGTDCGCVGGEQILRRCYNLYSCFCLAGSVMDLLCSVVCAALGFVKPEIPRSSSPGHSQDWNCGIWNCGICPFRPSCACLEDVQCHRSQLGPPVPPPQAALQGWGNFPHLISAFGKMLCTFPSILHPPAAPVPPGAAILDPFWC